VTAVVAGSLLVVSALGTAVASGVLTAAATPTGSSPRVPCPRRHPAVVVMNVDGSRPVAAELTAGVTAPDDVE
jgi:hypothetical protein